MFNETDVAVSRLEEPLNIEDLMGRCPEFSIKPDACDLDLEEDTDLVKVYGHDAVQEYYLTENLDVDSDDESVDPTAGHISKSFPIFRKRMNNLTEDGKIMKEVDKEGIGEPIGDSEPNIVAYVHYAGYAELDETPFDVTRLRQKKHVPLRLGAGEILPGLEMAIRSMREKESAKFLIHHDLAFGEKGVPPRIPPKGNLLFTIELDRFTADVKIDQPIAPLTFAERMVEVKKCRVKGNAMKKTEKRIKNAIDLYRKGVTIALQGFANLEEEKEAETELIRLYCNLAVCYMAIKNYKKVCTMFNEAQHDCPRLAPGEVKLFFNSAKALRFLKDFDMATRRLRKALQIKPGDEDILKEMQILSEWKEKDRQAEKNLYRNMFGTANQPVSKSSEEELERIMNSVAEDFKRTVEDILDTFMESEERTTEFSEGFSGKQLVYFRKQCAERNIEVRTCPGDELTGLPKVIIKKRVL